MPKQEDLIASLGLDISKYEQNLQTVIRSARKAENALDMIVDAANAAEKALNSISTGAIDIKGGVSIDDAAIKRLESIGNVDVRVNPLVDDTAIRNALSLVGNLEGASPRVSVQVDEGKLDTVLRRADDSVDFDVTADVSAAETQLGKIEEELRGLHTLAKIELIVNSANAIQQIQNIPLVGGAIGTIAEQDKAVRAFTSRSGRDIEDVGSIIENIYGGAFGDSREEVALNLAEVAKLGVEVENLEGVTAAAFTTADLTGEDFNTVLRTANNLVTSGLVPNLQAGFDVINTGFENGLNRSDDFLDTLTEYAPIFADAGIGIEEFLALLDQGLEAGAFNTDKIADTVKEQILRVKDAVSQESEGGPLFELLDKVGQVDEAKAYLAGETTGTEFYTGYLAAIEQGLADGTITAQDVFDLGGGPVEDLTIPVLLALDPLQVKEEFALYDGTTVEAGIDLYGDIGTAITEVQRVIENEVAQSFDEAFDITGKIDQFKVGIQDFAALIRDGEGIPEAIEVAFEIEGFAAFFHNVESLLGEILLGTLEVAAAVLDLVGNTEAAASVREFITEQATVQLAFDIKTAETEEELRAAVTSALRRGVAEEDVLVQAELAVTELVEQGNIEEAAKVVGLIQEAAKVFGAEVPDGAREAVEAYQEAIDNAGILAPLVLRSAEIEALADDIIVAEALDSKGAQIADSFVASMKARIDQQLAEGDLFGALDSARQSGNTGLISFVESALQNAFQTAIESGNFVEAKEIADQVGGEQLKAELDQSLQPGKQAFEQFGEDVIGFFQPLSDVFSTATDDVGTFVTDSTGDLQGWQTDSETVFGVVETAVTTFTNTTKTEFEGLIELAGKLTAAVQAVATATSGVQAPGVGSAGGGGGGDAAPAASGGIREGWTLVGEQGPELAFFDERMAILNNTSSERMSVAMAEMMASLPQGGDSSVDNRRVDNRRVTVNAQSAAEVAGTRAVIDQIRGFA